MVSARKTFRSSKSALTSTSAVVNLMVWADPNNGRAAWDIFRAEDVDEVSSLTHTLPTRPLTNATSSFGTTCSLCSSDGPRRSSDCRTGSRLRTSACFGALRFEELANAWFDCSPFLLSALYIDIPMRARLLEEKGIAPLRIWQRPGQLVFVPAGCLDSSFTWLQTLTNGTLPDAPTKSAHTRTPSTWRAISSPSRRWTDLSQVSASLRRPPTSH